MKRLAQQVDRRAASRSEVVLEARICLPGGVYLPCTVRNISGAGAGLELTYEAFVPLQFLLQIPSDGFEAACTLKHRRDTVVGVEFITARTEAQTRYG